jgi:hypothetical protein
MEWSRIELAHGGQTAGCFQHVNKYTIFISSLLHIVITVRQVGNKECERKRKRKRHCIIFRKMLTKIRAQQIGGFLD